MIRYVLPLLGLLALTACGGSAPPQSFAPLTYSYLPPIVLNVSTVTVVNQYVPDSNAAALIAQDPAPPAATLDNVLTRRLVAGGAPGTATVTIEAASINQQAGNFTGVMSVRVDVQSADGRSHGYTEASVTHSASVPDDSSQVPAALYDMTKQLMDAMNVQLQYQLQHNLSNWISYTSVPGSMPAANMTPPALYPAAPATGASTPVMSPAAPPMSMTAPDAAPALAPAPPMDGTAPVLAPAPAMYGTAPPLAPAPPMDGTAPALAPAPPMGAAPADMSTVPSNALPGGIEATPLSGSPNAPEPVQPPPLSAAPAQLPH